MRSPNAEQLIYFAPEEPGSRRVTRYIQGETQPGDSTDTISFPARFVPPDSTRSDNNIGR